MTRESLDTVTDPSLSFDNARLTRSSGTTPKTPLTLRDSVAAGALLVTLLLAALNLPTTFRWLEWLGVMLLLIALWPGRGQLPMTPFVKAVLALIPLVVLVQLIPLPFSVWSALPGRDFYATALTTVGPELASPRPLSLAPEQTFAGIFYLAAPLGVFMLVLMTPMTVVRSLTLFVVMVAAVQSLYALRQFLGASEELWQTSQAQVLVVGTFATRQQLVGLLELVFPVAFALFAATLGRPKTHEQYRDSWHGMLIRPLAGIAGRSMWYAGTLGLILVAIIASRLALAQYLALAGVIFCAMSFSGRLGGTGSFGWRGVVAFLAGCVLIGMVLMFAANSLAITALGEPGEAVFLSTLAAAREFFPWGSGFSTFNSVMPRFESDLTVLGLHQPDSDYLSWFLGGGVLAIVVIVGVFAGYLQHWWWMLQYSAWSTTRFIQVGAGFGLLLAAVHSLFDANLHQPANAIFAAFVAGLFFRRTRPPRSRSLRRQSMAEDSENTPLPVLSSDSRPHHRRRRSRSDKH